MATKPTPYDCLEAFDAESGDLNVIIETPKGSRNKFDYEPKLGIFKLGGVLPAGAVFPYDFGFVPATLGGDGDPMDVLVLMDEPAFTGCLVPSRLIGVIEAEQTERDGETTRNDRLIAVAANSHNHQDVHTLNDVTTNLVDEIEHFFISYNQAKGKEFKPLKRSGPTRARHLVEEGIEQAKQPDSSGKKALGQSKAK
ncbi:MAG TPA: inorganic diphosphatase [Chloroflexia bacterium]|nr:inorganic diphosphatase [Chloroflexia bacterium]